MCGGHDVEGCSRTYATKCVDSCGVPGTEASVGYQCILVCKFTLLRQPSMAKLLRFDCNEIGGHGPNGVILEEASMRSYLGFRLDDLYRRTRTQNDREVATLQDS